MFSLKKSLVPGALLVLGGIPVVAGVVRLGQLLHGGPIVPESQRYFASPLPITLHVFAIILFGVLGPAQFAVTRQGKRLSTHRWVGYALLPAGLLAAASGLWMTCVYPVPAGDDGLLYGARLVVGTGMSLSLLLGAVRLGQRRFRAHGAWMTRGYALGMGAGTQAFLHLPWLLTASPTPSGNLRAVLMTIGWLGNALFAEWLIRRRRAATTQTGSSRTHAEKLPQTYSGSRSQPAALPR